MKILEQDKKVFAALSKSELGKGLVDYLRRLQGDICDSRNWGPNETKDSANKIANLLETEVCAKIMLYNAMKKSEVRDFE